MLPDFLLLHPVTTTGQGLPCGTSEMWRRKFGQHDKR